MKLRTGFSFMALAQFIIVLALGYFSYQSVDRLLELQQLNIVNNAIRQQMELDMVHDALRADIGLAVTSVGQHSPEEFGNVSNQLAEHQKAAQEKMQMISAIDMPANLKQDYTAIFSLWNTYLQSSTETMQSLGKTLQEGSAPPRPRRIIFIKQFSALETQMAGMSDKITAWSAAITEQGKQAADFAHSSILAAIACAVGFTIIFNIYAKLGMFRPLAKLEHFADELAKENYNIESNLVTRNNEIGHLAQSLENLRRKAADAFMLKRMIDDMPINVMSVDVNDGFKVNYMNNASLSTLRKMERYLPVKADEIHGKSFDMFHKNPEHQRRLLANPSNLPHRAKITLGSEVMELNVSAIYDTAGNYSGAMLTWMIVTQNMRLADEFESSVGEKVESVLKCAEMLEHNATALRASIEELSVSALEISKRTNDSLRIVEEAVTSGEQGAIALEEMRDASDRMSNVIKLIQNISSQTNLLSLNATIEAARAGDLGKGFAVVASEVKGLANQTGSATHDISAQIEQVRSSSVGAVDKIRAITEIVKKMNEVAVVIASAVEEQQASTQEIASNIIGSASNAFSPNQQGLRNCSVLALASDLNSISRSLKDECVQFVQKVRAM